MINRFLTIVFVASLSRRHPAPRRRPRRWPEQRPTPQRDGYGRLPLSQGKKDEKRSLYIAGGVVDAVVSIWLVVINRDKGSAYVPQQQVELRFTPARGDLKSALSIARSVR